MKTNLRKYLTASLLVLASASSFSLAASNTTAQKQTQKQTQQVQKTGQKQTPNNPQNQIKLEVSYYDGDPLNGGKLIKTVTSQHTRGPAPFADAPDNAKFAVVKDLRGSHVIDLSKQPDPSQVPDDRQGGPRGPQGDMNGGPNGQGGKWDSRGSGGPNGGQGKPGNLQKPQQGQQGMKAPQEGGRGFGLLGGGKVTFYDGDPLNGGKATASFDSNAQKADLDAAAQKAKFAVVERGNGKVIIELGAR